MQYNYPFHLHRHLVVAIQMLEWFERFDYDRYVHIVSWYGKFNYLSIPCFMVYRISSSRKRIFDCFQKDFWRSRKFFFLYPFSEETSTPMPSKGKVRQLFQCIMIHYMSFWTLSYPLQYEKRLPTWLQVKKYCVNSRMSRSMGYVNTT